VSYVFVNVEFVNVCRFRVFQCHFRSRVSIPAFSVTPALTRTNREYWKLHARIFTKHWKCCDKFFVLTMSLYAFISLLYKQLLQYTLLKSFIELTIHCINQMCKEVPYETFSISFHFHKIVHENTFALTPLCFIWVSRAIAKHARIVLTAFCHCSRLLVNGITESSNI